MAEGDALVFNSFKEYVMEGVFNLKTGGHTLKATLHTGYTPDIDAHDVWADVSATEYSTAAGYTAGGKTLGNQDVTLDTGNDRGKFDADDLTWASLGPLSPATPGHLILWDDTPSSPADPLIACWVLGTTATNGGNYTVAWNTAGILTIS